MGVVGDHLLCRKSLQARCGLSKAVRLTWSQQMLHGIAQTVVGRINLRCELVTQPADLVMFVAVRAPAAGIVSSDYRGVEHHPLQLGALECVEDASPHPNGTAACVS